MTTRTRDKMNRVSIRGTHNRDLSYVSDYWYCVDVNNGPIPPWPDSSCHMSYARARNFAVHELLWGSVAAGGSYNPPLVSFADTDALGFTNTVRNNGRLLETTERGGSIAASKLRTIRDEGRVDFNLLAFLKESGELGDMFKRIYDYRFIDYAFGIKPLWEDIRNWISHCQLLFSKWNAETRRARSGIPLRKLILVDRWQEVGGPATERLFINYLVKIRMTGNVTVAAPLLTHVSPEVLDLFDRLCIDPSFSTFWEVTPYSWLIDWFLPVGQYLESLPSLVKGDVRFDGTVSTVVRADAEITTKYTSVPWWPESGMPLGLLFYKGYTRTLLSQGAQDFVKLRLNGGINSPDKLLILRDIVFPAKGTSRVSQTD